MIVRVHHSSFPHFPLAVCVTSHAIHPASEFQASRCQLLISLKRWSLGHAMHVAWFDASGKIRQKKKEALNVAFADQKWKWILWSSFCTQDVFRELSVCIKRTFEGWKQTAWMTCSSNQVQVRVCHHWHLLSSYSHSLLEANSMSIFLLWQHEHGAYTPVDTYHLSARTPGAFCFALHHHTFFFSLNLLIRFNHKTLLGLLLL